MPLGGGQVGLRRRLPWYWKSGSCRAMEIATRRSVGEVNRKLLALRPRPHPTSAPSARGKAGGPTQVVEFRPPEWVRQQAPIGSEASVTAAKHPSRSPKLGAKVREAGLPFGEVAKKA